MTWRTDRNDNRFKIESGESDIQDEIDGILQHKEPERVDPTICQVCGSGGVSTTVFPTTGLTVCETCFGREFERLSPEEQEAILSAAEAVDTLVEAPSVQSFQPQNADYRKCSRCGIEIADYGKGGSARHWAQYHPNEV